jgi:predicted acylesterase/phospholipase RssA
MARNVALVLSSGGARGVAHIGVIEELIRVLPILEVVV